MELVKLNVGGALVRWIAGRPPAAVDIFSGGVHVLRQSLIAFTGANLPVANLVDDARLSGAMAEVEIVEGPTEGIGWGANVGEGWSVEGEDTPFAYRDSTADPQVCRFDLSHALGLHDFVPIAGQAYYLAADTAQQRCGVGLSIEWLDAHDRLLDREECWRETGPRGGTRATDYAQMVVSAACPAGATRLRLVLVQGPPTEGSDAYVFFRRLALTTSNPVGRTVLKIGPAAAAAGMAAMAILPLGDAARLFAGPLEVDDGTTRLAIALPEADAGAAEAEAGTSLWAIGNGPDIDISLSATAEASFCLSIDDRFQGFVTLRPENGFARLSFRLPDTLLDGQDHWVELRGATLGERRFGGRITLVAMQTPAAILQSHTSRIDHPAVLPFADLRYAALTASIERLGRVGTPDPDALAELAKGHRIVLGGPRPEQRRFDRLRLPHVADPFFSIVIPVHNKFHLTYLAVAAILFTCAGLAYEVIVVDDGSSDTTRDVETILEGVRVVRHAQAQGFVGACNAGAAAARGGAIVFLNNDTEVVGRWLEELYLPFTLFSDTGMTGAKLLYPDGRLQEAGGIVWGNGRPWNVGRGGNPADPAFCYTRQVDYISGAAIMVSAEVWAEVGGFGREFAPAYYEDTDLAFKIRDAGYRTVFAAKAQVIHYEGQSNGTEVTGGGLKRFQEINRPKFEAKWRRAYRLGSPEGATPELEKDRGQIGRALVLDYQPPRFDKDAGSYAIAQEIRLLQGLGYKVTLATLNCAHLGTYTDAFERGGVEHLHAPFFASLQDVIERRGPEFDLVYIHRYTTAEGLVELIRRHAPAARILLNCADLHFLRELRAARLENSAEGFDRALRTRQRELTVLGQVDAVLTYSDVEKAIIETYLGFRARVHLLPWVAPGAPSPVPLDAREGIGFIGSYDHPPNRDAVDFFLAECWPAIRRRDPDVRFHIAGSGFEKFQLAVPDDRVEVVGWVADASDFLGRRRLMVAPLRTGAGVKGKVIDAFNSGTPSILSPIAAEGIVSGGDRQIVARDAGEWVDRVCRLLADDAAWAIEAAAARERIMDRFSYEHGLSVLRPIFASVELPHVAQVAGADREAFAPVVPFSDMHKALDAVAGRRGATAPMLADAAE